MRRLRDQVGQTAAEYVGLLFVVSVLIAGIAASGVDRRVADAVRQTVCRTLNGASGCPEASVRAKPRVTQAQRLAQMRREQAFLRATDPALDDLNQNGVPDPNEFVTPEPAAKAKGLLSRAVDGLHVAADGCGLVPGAGEFCDLGNAGLYGLQGDKTNAGISLASSVPIVGDAATAAKYARKAKLAAEVAAKAKRAERVEPLLRRIAPDTFRSRGGLVYGPDRVGSPFRNRVQHVLAHTTPDASKPLHTVFSGPRSGVLPLLDEAWARRIKPAAVGKTRMRFDVDMGRRVGTAGETRVRIVVDRGNPSSVVTAYPIR